jgi:hypothetical protein
MFIRLSVGKPGLHRLPRLGIFIIFVDEYSGMSLSDDYCRRLGGV